MFLLYFAEDPVRVFDHEPAPTHAVIKLFLDLFSTDSTAALFYTNDVKVLIDIIVRNISDLSPGDKVCFTFRTDNHNTIFQVQSKIPKRKVTHLLDI